MIVFLARKIPAVMVDVIAFGEESFGIHICLPIALSRHDFSTFGITTIRAQQQRRMMSDVEFSEKEEADGYCCPEHVY